MNSMRMRKFFDSASVITISVNFMALDLSHPERPREGWPLLLTADSEANGDSRSTYERGPSLVGLLGSMCRYKRFMSCLGCSSRPSTKYFFINVRYSLHLYPSLSKLDMQSCRVTCLLICVSGDSGHTPWIALGRGGGVAGGLGGGGGGTNEGAVSSIYSLWCVRSCPPYKSDVSSQAGV